MFTGLRFTGLEPNSKHLVYRKLTYLHLTNAIGEKILSFITYGKAQNFQKRSFDAGMERKLLLYRTSLFRVAESRLERLI